MTTPSASSQSVDLTALSQPQLSQLKQQLDTEISHLSSSFSQLRSAQSKFRECIKAIRDGVSADTAGKEVLVPLTSSLYVPGRLAGAHEGGEQVVVDVGTGFLVEKSTKDAVAFYTEKVEELDANLKDLDAILQGKAGNLRVVEDVLRQKVLAGGGGGAATATAA